MLIAIKQIKQHYFNQLYYKKLDALCDTTTKLDIFVALQAFDRLSEKSV